MSEDKSPRAVAESYWKAECERDLEAVRQHYWPDAIFQGPGGTLTGWDEVKSYYADSFARYPGLEVEIVHDFRSGNEGAIEWSAVLIDHDGRRFPFAGVNIVKVEGGRFRHVHAYFDPSILDS